MPDIPVDAVQWVDAVGSVTIIKRDQQMLIRMVNNGCPVANKGIL